MPEPTNLNNLPPDVLEKYLEIKSRLPELRAELDQEFEDRRGELAVSAELADLDRQARRHFIAQLRDLRIARGLSEVDVERAAGMPRSTISELEASPRADGNISVLQRYAAILGRTLVLSLGNRDAGEGHESSLDSAVTVGPKS